MFDELNRKFKLKIFSLIAAVLLINFMMIFFSYSYIMKSDYRQKVIHVCEKSAEYILLKLNSVEDTAVAFSKDNNLKSALYTYSPYVLKTITELKTVNEDIASAFVIGEEQSYFYDPSDKTKFAALLPADQEEMQVAAEGQWIIHHDALLYICKIYHGEETIGLLGFRLQDDLFRSIFEDYSDYFLQDVKAVIFNENDCYSIFGKIEPEETTHEYLEAEAGGTKKGGTIIYKVPYNKNLSVLITTSEKHMDNILIKLLMILLLILVIACVLLYLLLTRYLDFVTDKLKQLRLKIQGFSNELE